MVSDFLQRSAPNQPIFQGWPGCFSGRAMVG
jgi:hypothetical protein